MEHISGFRKICHLQKAFQCEFALMITQQIEDYSRFFCRLAFITFKAIDFFNTAISALSRSFSASRRLDFCSAVSAESALFFSGMSVCPLSHYTLPDFHLYWNTFCTSLRWRRWKVLSPWLCRRSFRRSVFFLRWLSFPPRCRS